MGHQNSNHNVAIVRRAAVKLGAKVLRVRGTGKHNILLIETAEGLTFWFNVSQGHIDPFKQRGWLRQAVTNAAARSRMDQRTKRR